MAGCHIEVQIPYALRLDEGREIKVLYGTSVMVLAVRASRRNTGLQRVRSFGISPTGGAGNDVIRDDFGFEKAANWGRHLIPSDEDGH